MNKKCLSGINGVIENMYNSISEPRIEVIYDENSLIAINKPWNIPTSGKTLDDPDAIQFWLEKKYARKMWAVHQLDADTTGVNLFVTEKRSVSLYQRSLSNCESTKCYYVIVHGVPEWEMLDCCEPIGFVGDRHLGVHPTGKSAFSRFYKLQSSGDYTLILAKIFTGRTHQIRIHLFHMGFPLVGDDWYSDRPVREHVRQALHARTVRLVSPKPLELIAPFPDDFEVLANRLGLDLDI